MSSFSRTRELGYRQPIGWIGLVFFSVMALCATWSGQPSVAVVLGALSTLSVATLCGRTTVTIDAVGVTREGRFGRYHIAWDDIQRVDTDGVALVLTGDRKRLPVAPRFWDPQTGSAAKLRLDLELMARGVPVVRNPVASRLTAVNTRIRAPRA